MAVYPNPATEQATVAFRAQADGTAQVVVYNQLGQRVATLIIYLNDVEESGDTIFPKLGLSIVPRNGRVDLASGHAVGQRDRQRHQLGGLVAGVAEHQALVAGALSLDQVLRDRGALLGGRVAEEVAGLEAEFRLAAHQAQALPRDEIVRRFGAPVTDPD